MFQTSEKETLVSFSLQS